MNYKAVLSLFSRAGAAAFLAVLALLSSVNAVGARPAASAPEGEELDVLLEEVLAWPDPMFGESISDVVSIEDLEFGSFHEEYGLTYDFWDVAGDLEQELEPLGTYAANLYRTTGGVVGTVRVADDGIGYSVAVIYYDEESLSEGLESPESGDRLLLHFDDDARFVVTEEAALPIGDSAVGIFGAAPISLETLQDYLVVEEATAEARPGAFSAGSAPFEGASERLDLDLGTAQEVVPIGLALFLLSGILVLSVRRLMT
jgi:hypothetical protein